MAGIRVAVLLLGLLCCHDSGAQAIAAPFTNLRVVPNPASAGQPIAARLFGSGCATFPVSESITIEGNVVTLTHETDEICGVPLPGGDWDFPIGTFPPGHYTLIYAPTSGFGGNTYVTQSVQFDVLPTGIPASSLAGLAMLILALLGVGVWQVRFRRTRPRG